MRAFLERGYKVFLLTSSGKKKLLLDPAIEVVELTQDGPFSFINLWRFERAVQKWLVNHPHGIVFGLDRTTSQDVLRAGNGCHAAYLKLRRASFFKRLSFLCNPLHRLLLYLEKRGFENPNLKLLITNSLLVKKQILAHYKTPAAKIHVLHNGVEWKEFQRPFDEWEPVRQRLKKEWQIPEDHTVLLFAGHGFARKGLRELLLALRHFEKVTLLVVGKDKHLERYSSPQARFFGAQDSLIPFLQVADSLVIASHYDPFANVTLEALAMGLFVCSSRTNGGAEILSSVNGTVINDLFNPSSFQKALEETLKHRKTPSSASMIRHSVEAYDYQHYMQTLITEVESAYITQA